MATAFLGGARAWIQPDPSGLDAHYPPPALAVEFTRLRVASGRPGRSGLMADGPFAGS
ncbi:hypothetical protein [Streptomyces sediminimaris]|uniref:hypothetical protein n=1 Tax=Streptomyces sediminimaris TaxID=3383721 RepID=UPI00399AEF6A